MLNIQHPGQGFSPLDLQVDCLRRLVYEEGDVILIAKTGFGKSIILHAFSVLTGLTTLQIIPLNKLGGEQL
jgi:superfamily II DNA or RNA helicase